MDTLYELLNQGYKDGTFSDDTHYVVFNTAVGGIPSASEIAEKLYEWDHELPKFKKCVLLICGFINKNKPDQCAHTADIYRNAKPEKMKVWKVISEKILIDMLK